MADLLDNLGDIDLDITNRLPRAKPVRPEFRRPLGEEEYKSLGRRALDTGLGALEYIGGTLAKPGYAARGVLAGRPSALKNLIPFGDTLGITDEADHTSGRDLANLWGLTRKNDQGWGAWGTGLALDMLTDPLTYVGGIGPRAAQTGLGKGAAKIGATKGWTARELMQGFEEAEPALRAAGKTSEEIAHEAARGTRIASPQAIRSIQREVPSLAIDTLSPERTGVEGLAHGGLIKLTGPFGYGPSMVLGTGKRSQQIAGLFDKVGDKLKFGNRFGRTLNTLFDPRVRGATTEATQRAAFQHGTPVLQEAMERGRLGFYDVRKELDPALKAAGGNEELALNAIRAAGERAPDVGLFPGEALQGAQPAAAQLRTLMDRQAEERIARGLGKNLEEGTAGVEYVPRQASEAVGKGSRSQPPGNQKGPFPTATAANIHRKEWLTDLPAGSGRINDWFARFAGSKDKKGAFGAIYTDLVNDAIASGHLQQLNQPAIEALEKQAKLVASRVTKSDLKYRAPGNFSPQELQALGGNLPANAGQPFLSPDLFGDIQRSTRGHAHALANQASLIGGVAANAEPMREGLIPLPKLIRRARLQTTQAEGQAAQGALVDLATALAKPTAARPGMGLFDYTRPVAELQAELGKYGVRPELAKEFLGAYERPQLGEGLKPVVGAFDSFNNLFRSLVYPLFPASHVRNAMTATASNLREGTGLGGYGKGLRAMTGNTAADEALRRTLYGYGGVFEPDGGFSGEISGLANKFRKGEPISPSLPGADIAGPYKNVLADTANLIANEGLYQGGKAHLRALTQGIGGLFDKNRTWGQAIAENLGIRGVGGATTDVNPLIQTGRKVGGNIENFFRGSLMSHLMDQGYSPSVAADVMRKLHFDPQDLTQFERQVMKRVVPFYCVTDDAEILSRRGWITVDELKIGEDVLSLDHQTGESHWVPCEDKSVFDHDGVLMSIGRGRDEFLCTADHRWPVIVDSKMVGKPRSSSRQIKRAYELRSNHFVPRTSEYRGTKSIATPKEAAIVGWLVTDGHMKRRGNHVGMTIYQLPSKHLDEIIDLLGEDGTRGNPHPESGVVPVYIVGETRRRIQELLPGKESVVSLVCRLSREAAESCLDAMMKAEGTSAGTYQKTGYLNDFAQKEGPVLDAFQILAQLCGLAAHKSSSGAYISVKNTRLKITGAVGTKRHKGRVWCPTTKYGTWLMRRKGRIIWTGNSFSRHNLPLQVETLLTRPRVINAQLAPFRQPVPEGTGYIPSYLQGGLATPTGPEENGKRQYISGFGLPIEEAFGRFSFKNGLPDLMHTGREALGMTSPLIKAPLEQLFDTQLYSGRKLSDLRPQGMVSAVGRAFGEENPQALAQLIANTPASRFVSSIDKLMDPRKTALQKALNLGTGLRITDVDVDRQRAIETRDAIANLMSGHPNISKSMDFYVRPEDIANLTPEEVQLMRLQTTQKELAAKKAREGKKKTARILP